MSIGFGVVPLYGSYRKRNNNILEAALVVPFLVLCCGLMAAIVVFSYIGYISHISNIGLD